MFSRTIRRAWPVLWCVTLAAAADEPLTEPEAIRRALETDPSWTAALRESELEVASTRVGTRPPDPRLSWSRESAAGADETFVVLEQDVPIGGAFGARRDAAGARRKRAEIHLARARQTIVRDVRLAFRDASLRQREIDAFREALDRVDRLVAALKAREAAGDASRYDCLRAERERARVGSELRRSQGELAAAIAALERRIGPGVRAVATTGIPADPGPLSDRLRSATSSRPDLLAASADEERLASEAKAAARTRIPTPTLAAGIKSVRDGAIEDDGTVVSVGLAIPLFDGGRAASAAAGAAWKRAIASRAELLAQVEAEVRAAHARACAAFDAWTAWRGETARAFELAGIAELAHAEGEIGILERLDAEQVLHETRRRELEIEAEAFRTGIELDFATGTEVGR